MSAFGPKRHVAQADERLLLGEERTLQAIPPHRELTQVTPFTVEFLQNYFRERWSRSVAQGSFGGRAVRKCDVNNSGSNSVGPANWTTVVIGTADVDFCLV